MRFGLFVSVLFHLCLAGGFILWGKDWSSPRDFTVEPAIPVELISEARLAEITNVPAAAPEAEPEQAADPVVPDEPVAILQEPIIVADADVAPVAPPPPPKKEEEKPKVVEPKKEPEVVKEPEPPKPKPVVKKDPPKPKGLDLDALEADAKAAKKDQAPKTSPSETVGPKGGTSAGGELTATETALVRAAMLKCWTPLDGAPNPEKLKVLLTLKLRPNGTLNGAPKVENAAQITLSGNRYWKVSERNAVQALVKCAPYDFLPQARYDAWKELKFNFVPPSY